MWPTTEAAEIVMTGISKVAVGSGDKKRSYSAARSYLCSFALSSRWHEAS